MSKFYLILKFLLYEIYHGFQKITRIKILIKDLYFFQIFKLLIKEQSLKFRNQNLNIFLRENKKLWKKNTITKTNDNKRSKILVTSFVHAHPAYPYLNGIIASYLKNYFNLDLIGFCDENDLLSHNILKSFNIKKFFFLKDKNLFSKILSFFKAIKILKKINNIDSLLKLKYLGIDIGKITFDDVIRRTGDPTINKINFKLIYHFSKSIIVSDQFKKIINENNIKAIVQAETQFIPSAIIFQLALKNGIKVYSRSGVSRLSVRVYKNFNERYSAREEFSKKIFNITSKKYKFSADTGLKILKNRFRGSSSFDNLRDSKWAHGNKKNYSRKELYRLLNFNFNKPLVIIFCHSLIDGNFATGARVFRDNLQWLRFTLNSIKKIKHYNWIIKPHPMDWEYKLINTNTLVEYNKIINDLKHVKLCPKNLSSNSILKLTRAIVTSHGSSAQEYTAFGIPSISSGEASYSKFEINYRAKNSEQYSKLLMKSAFLKKPTSQKIDISRKITFIQNRILGNKNILIPEHDYTKKVNHNKFYIDCIRLINRYNSANDNFKKKFFNQLNLDLDHTI